MKKLFGLLSIVFSIFIMGHLNDDLQEFELSTYTNSVEKINELEFAGSAGTKYSTTTCLGYDTRQTDSESSNGTCSAQHECHQTCSSSSCPNK